MAPSPFAPHGDSCPVLPAPPLHPHDKSDLSDTVPSTRNGLWDPNCQTLERVKHVLDGETEACREALHLAHCHRGCPGLLVSEAQCLATGKMLPCHQPGQSKTSHVLRVTCVSQPVGLQGWARPEGSETTLCSVLYQTLHRLGTWGSLVGRVTPIPHVKTAVVSSPPQPTLCLEHGAASTVLRGVDKGMASFPPSGTCEALEGAASRPRWMDRATQHLSVFLPPPLRAGWVNSCWEKSVPGSPPAPRPARSAGSSPALAWSFP